MASTGPGPLCSACSSFSFENPRNPSTYETIIGFDFAATLSAVSFAKRDIANGESWSNLKTNAVKLLKKWPHKSSAIPVPTVVSYIANGIDWGYGAKQSPCHAGQVAEFKSLLRNCDETSQANSKLGMLASKLEKKRTDFIVDYLSLIHNYVVSQVTQEVDSEVKRLLWKVGVPPTLTLSELRTAKQWFKEAGFATDNLVFASEIEASLTACLRTGLITVNRKNRFIVRIVVDGGGLTVDSAVYLLKGIDSISVQEILAEEGIISGGSRLLQNFTQIIDSKLKERPYSLDDKQKICDLISKHFESRFKSTFDGSQDYTANTALFRDLVEVVDPGFQNIFLSKDNIKDKVFDPVIKSIQELIQKQLNRLNGFCIRKENVIIHLSGGLFQNLYISQSLKKNLASENNFGKEESYKIDIFQDIGYRKQLVSQGLVWMGANDNSRNRVSGFTLGIEMTYDPNQGDSSSEGDSDESEEVQAVAWMLSYDQIVSEETKICSVATFHDIDFKAAVENGLHFSQRLAVCRTHLAEKTLTLREDVPEDVVEYKTLHWHIDSTFFARTSVAEDFIDDTIPGISVHLEADFYNFNAPHQHPNTFLKFSAIVKNCPGIKPTAVSDRGIMIQEGNTLPFEFRSHSILDRMGSLGKGQPFLDDQDLGSSTGLLVRIPEDEIEQNRIYTLTEQGARDARRAPMKSLPSPRKTIGEGENHMMMDPDDEMARTKAQKRSSNDHPGYIDASQDADMGIVNDADSQVEDVLDDSKGVYGDGDQDMEDNMF